MAATPRRSNIPIELILDIYHSVNKSLTENTSSPYQQGLFCRWVMKKIILDACCGSRMFYFDKQNPFVLFADKRDMTTTFKDRDKIRTLDIKPDVIHDFTNMPYPDESFYHVVFDPPHLNKGGENSWLVKKYGKLPKGWEKTIKKGFDECMRVLKTNGTLIFKWNETQIPLSKILSVINYTPVYGHKSGKSNNTHWLAFVKTKGD